MIQKFLKTSEIVIFFLKVTNETLLTKKTIKNVYNPNNIQNHNNLLYMKTKINFKVFGA